MYRALFVIPLLVLFSACAPGPDGSADTAGPQAAELDMDAMDVNSGREAKYTWKCPSEHASLYSVSCDARAWGPPSLAIAACVKQVNQQVEKLFQKDFCSDCSHGKPCDRVLPLWDNLSFGRAGSRCKTTALPYGWHSAQCVSVPQSGRFKCVETDRKVKDKDDEYVDDPDDYAPVY